MKRFLLTILVSTVLVNFWNPIHAQDGEQHFPITRDNAAHVTQQMMLGRGTIEDLAWSPDGETLAAASSVGVWLYDAMNLETVPYLLTGHTKPVTSLAYSADGTLLASGSEDGTVQVWDTTTYELLPTLETGAEKVLCVAFAPDGTVLTAGDSRGVIHLWDARIGAVLFTLQSGPGEVTTLAFSPDGTELASGNTTGQIQRWDITGAEIATLGSYRELLDIAYSSNATLVFTAFLDNTHFEVALRDTDSSLEETQVLERGEYLLYSDLALDPSRQTIAVTRSNSLIMWDLNNGEIVFQAEDLPGSLTSVIYSPDGTRLALGYLDGTLQVWDAATFLNPYTLNGYGEKALSLAFDPHNTIVAVGMNESEGTVNLWDTEDGAFLENLEWPEYAGDTNSLVFTRDGTRLVTGHAGGTIHFWDMTTRRALEVWDANSSVYSVASSPDGTTIASGGADGGILVWDMALGEIRFHLNEGMSYVSSVAFHPEGILLAGQSYGRTVGIWDMATGQIVMSLTDSSGCMAKVAFSPAENILASGGWNGIVCLWNISTGQVVGQLKGPSSDVLTLDFSPDGTILAVGYSNGDVLLWDVSTHMRLSELRGHTRAVNGIAFSSDGMQIASASDDGTVRLWGVP